MIPEIYVSFVIEEEAVNEELLNLLRTVGATDSWQKGQIKGRSTITYQHNGCAFKARPVRDFSLENAINSFWNDFALEKTELRKVIQTHALTPILSIAVYADDVIPSIHFERGFLKKLLEFNAGVDIDVILSA